MLPIEFAGWQFLSCPQPGVPLRSTPGFMLTPASQAETFAKIKRAQLVKNPDLKIYLLSIDVGRGGVRFVNARPKTYNHSPTGAVPHASFQTPACSANCLNRSTLVGLLHSKHLTHPSHSKSCDCE